MYNGEDSDLWQFGDFTSTNADWELDYVAIDNTGAIIGCNDGIIPGDVNGDCYVDFEDFALMASNWLRCNDLNNSDCL